MFSFLQTFILMSKIDWKDPEEVKKYKREWYRIKHNIPLGCPLKIPKINWKNREELNKYNRERCRKNRRIKNNLPLDHPIRKTEKRDIDWNNQLEVNKYRRKLYYRHQEKRKEKNLRKYDLTLKEFKEMCKEQEYKCLCCNKDMKNKKFMVDHDHITSAIRGLICLQCNTGIGLLGDNLNGLNNAVIYLSKFETSLF